MRAGPPVLRFAPSPNGRLHLGHAYSALLNADLARAMGGTCRLRIEDIDPLRSRAEYVRAIVADLAWLGLTYPEPVRRQSEHMGAYAAALADLAARGLAYPCFCSRGAIRARQGALAGEGARAGEGAEARGGEGRPAGEGALMLRDPDGVPLYPGTCRDLDPGEALARRQRGLPHTWRLDMARAIRAAGPLHVVAFSEAGERRTPAEPARWGDAVVARRDVPTSYHLAVVHDDAAEGVTHVVRGADLEAAADLHVLLQRLLGLPSPRYRHHPLIRDAEGGKLAKSRGSRSLADLREAGVTPTQIRARLGFA